MRGFRGANLILMVFLFGAALILLANPARADILNCNSCSSCNTQIQAAASGDIVQLTSSINNRVGICIDFNGKDGITFDCLGHTIDGDDTGGAGDYGIFLNNANGGSNNNIVRNCITRDFYDGLYIHSSSGNTLDSITSYSNTRNGIVLAYSSNNVLTNVATNLNGDGGLYIYISSSNTVTSSFANTNTNWGVNLYGSASNSINTVNAMENGDYDVFLGSVGSDSHCTNSLTNIIGSGGRPIAYYNYSVTLQDQVFSELILCNADNSQIRNITIIGSDSLNNNGLFVYRTEYSSIDRISSSSNYYGISLQIVSNSVVTNVTASSNAINGLYLSSSSGNTVWNVTAMENSQYDAYVDATADSHCANSLTNIIGSGGRPISYYNYSVTLQDQVLSGLILCNADGSQLTNITITGSASLDNNALILMRTDYANLTQIVSSDNRRGVFLYSSSNNELRNLNTYLNGQYGILLSASSNNTIANLYTIGNSMDGIELSTNSNHNVLDNIYSSSNTYYGGVTLTTNCNNNTLTSISAYFNRYGIQFLSGSNNNSVTNVNALYNSYYGIYFSSSSYNVISDSVSRESTLYDVYVVATADSHCDNGLANVNSTNNRPIMYYNYSVNLQDQVLAELILCNADYSNVTNVTITGSTSRKNNAVLMVRTDYANLTQINSSNRYYGFYLSASSNNRLTSITATNNAMDGIYMVSSSNNTIMYADASSNSRVGIRLNSNSDSNALDSITASSNTQSGIYIISSLGSVLTNITANYNTQSGVYLSSSSDSTLTDIIASSNSIHGVYLSANSDNNSLDNITASSNTQYGIYFSSSSDNTISNSAVEDNRYDINVDIADSSNCDNYLVSVTSSGGRPIAYYNYSVTLQDQVLSELILCNADNSQIRNITIIGSGSLKNNGVVLLLTDYARLTQVNSSYRYYGFYLSSSSNNVLENVTSAYNSQSGFYILNSNSNTLTYAEASFNSQRGVHFSGLSRYNTMNDSHMEGNSNYGLYFEASGTDYPRYNTLYNNAFINSNNFYSNNINNSNYWNVTSSPGPNIAGTLYIGGNYWGTPSHSGFSDLCPDADKDGFCDNAPYIPDTVYNNNTDYLPITTDKGPPDIWFVPPTPDNMAIVRSDYIEVNASLSEPAGTCILNWYDGAWWNYTMDAAPGGMSCYLNMTNLPNREYQFRVYANDTWGNMNVSETRQNRVLYIGPSFILAKFSVSTLHSQLGENRIIKMYVQNPDPVFANITVWLGGDYPAALAKFSNQPPQQDAYFTNDMRNLTVQLNPKNQMTFSVIILSTGPRDGGYNLTLDANTTGSGKKDSDTMGAFVDYPANFPGLELWAMLALVACAGLIFWIRKK